MKTKKSEKVDLERKRPLFFSISFVITLGLVFAAFSWKTPVQKPVEIERLILEAPDEIFIPQTAEEKEKIEPEPFTVELFDLVDNDEDIDDSWMDDLDLEPDDEGVDPYAIMRLQDEKKDVEEDVVVDWADEMPEFPGGMKALLNFLGNSVKYPTIAQETGVQGRVIVNFIVNKDGGISDAKIIRGVDPALDKEALRVVNMMPKWKPGMQSGKAIRVRYVVPINFKLQ